MSPKERAKSITSFIHTDENFGVEVLKFSEIPSPVGRGRTALVPQLTIAKMLHQALQEAKINGVGVSEQICGFNLEAPGTKKEAEKLGIKKIAISFFSYVTGELKFFELENTLSVVRREGGKKIYLVGPHPEDQG